MTSTNGFVPEHLFRLPDGSYLCLGSGTDGKARVFLGTSVNMEGVSLDPTPLKYPDRIVVHTSRGNLVIHNNDRRPPVWNHHGATQLQRVDIDSVRVSAGHGFIRLLQPVAV